MASQLTSPNRGKRMPIWTRPQTVQDRDIEIPLFSLLKVHGPICFPTGCRRHWTWLVPTAGSSYLFATKGNRITRIGAPRSTSFA